MTVSSNPTGEPCQPPAARNLSVAALKVLAVASANQSQGGTMNGNDPYRRLKTALKADINDYSDEVTQVFEVTPGHESE